MPLKSGVSLVHLDEDVRTFVANTSTDPVPVQVVGAGGGAQDVNVVNEVEVKNDVDNPLSVSGSISVSNFPATQAVSATDLDIRNLTAAQDTVASRDIYTAGEALPDQSTAASVVVFTFSLPVQLVYVYGASALGQNTYRADPFGGLPSASQGIPCPDGVPTAIPVQTSVVRVFGVSGNVSVWGFRY